MLTCAYSEDSNQSTYLYSLIRVFIIPCLPIEYPLKAFKRQQGTEVIKLEYCLKIKRNDWLLVRKQPINALDFEFENELKFCKLGAWLCRMFRVFAGAHTKLYILLCSG